MKLLELMLALNKHYPDDRILMAIDQETGAPLPFHEQVEQTGDTLAVFLVNEISTAIEGEFLDDGHLSSYGWSEIDRTLDWIQSEVTTFIEGFTTISTEEK